MEFNEVLKILTGFSSKKLLGTEAHKEIAPYRVNNPKYTPSSPKEAAVLILLYPIKNETHFALIQTRIKISSCNFQDLFIK